MYKRAVCGNGKIKMKIDPQLNILMSKYSPLGAGGLIYFGNFATQTENKILP